MCCHIEINVPNLCGDWSHRYYDTMIFLFSKMVSVANLVFLKFKILTANRVQMVRCIIIMTNFVAIPTTLPRYGDIRFSYGGRLPSWIFKN